MVVRCRWSLQKCVVNAVRSGGTLTSLKNAAKQEVPSRVGQSDELTSVRFLRIDSSYQTTLAVACFLQSDNDAFSVVSSSPVAAIAVSAER